MSRIWILKTGEPVPFLPMEAGDRLYRAGALAAAATAQGHEVTWFTALFSHQQKTFRDVPADQVLSPEHYWNALGGAGPAPDNSPELVFLSSPGYRKHIAPRRFWDHHILGRRFCSVVETLEAPDVILSAWPTIDLTYAAVRFATAREIPVVIDVRDLWPDVIYERVEAKLPFSVRGSLLPYERMGRKSFQSAAAVTAPSAGMVDWARRRFGGDGSLDRVFHHALSRPAGASIDAGHIRFWRARGVDLTTPKTRFVWAGNLVQDTDAATLLAALEALPLEAARQIEVIICGKGALAAEIEEKAFRLPHLIYGGWVGRSELSALTEASHIGLLCYLDRFDFQISVPNKVVDYCAASMRTLSNLSGEVPKILEPSDSLIHYPTGDISALTALFAEIGSDPARYRIKHAPARAVFETHFDADRVFSDFACWLEDLR